jgi:nitrite reductase/ring-hydroxylating ferredoxin subunit
MDVWRQTIALSLLPPGSMKTVIVNGFSIALANVDGTVFAVSEQCTHEHCSLVDEGFLDGESIVCGCHGATFDCKTGAVLNPPATTPLQTYEVRIENNIICVKGAV